MSKFINPIYDTEYDNDTGKNEIRTSESTALSELEKIFESFTRVEEESTLDISTLDRKRRLQSKIQGNIDMGTLEVSFDEESDILDANSKKEELTKYFMQYFAILGELSNCDVFNYEYIQYLCEEANVNTKDIHGQSVMHEIARAWNTDVALFLKANGIEIDNEDDWGRTPLMVAVATNCVEMIRWFLDNGADMNHRTKNDGQLPIHIAARFNSVDAFDVLVEFGASPLAIDNNDKTPFHHAAEIGNVQICNHFLKMELPTASFDTNGVQVIDLLISNIPSQTYNLALNQFVEKSWLGSKQMNMYLNCLSKKRWQTLIYKKRNAQLSKFQPSSILEIITEKREYEAINHPVILKLIETKRIHYGNKFILLNNLLNIIFTIFWTISASIRSSSIDIVIINTSSKKTLILVVTLVSQFLTFLVMYKLYIEWQITKKHSHHENKRKSILLHNRISNCHPRWPSEGAFLASQKESLELTVQYFWRNGWIIIELVCLLLANIFTLITIVWYFDVEGSLIDSKVRMLLSAIFVLVVWLRLNRCFKYHQTFGPFVEMLEECLVASCQIGFLFVEFFLPFSIAFWVIFGQHPGNETDEYYHIHNLIYQLWLLTFIGDYDYDSLAGSDRLLAELLVGLFLVLLSIITFNIYIAMLSEAFARVQANSSQKAYLEEAKIYINIERLFPDIKKNSELYLFKECAPMIVDKSSHMTQFNTISVIKAANKITKRMNELMHKIIEDEVNQKRDLEAMEERFRCFQTKYTSKISRKMANVIKEVMAKSTDRSHINIYSSITEYFRTIKEKFEMYHEK